jgi:transposase-like protein
MDGGEPERIDEATPALPRRCPHCRGARLQRWGATGRGLARLRCAGCRRTFTSATGTSATGALAAGLRRRVAFERALGDMLGAEPSSCRRLAARLGVHHMTVWRWRIRVLARFVHTMPLVSGSETGVVRESRKASREWVNHAHWPEIFPPPPRPRWCDLAPGEAPPGGWAAWRVAVRLSRGGATVLLQLPGGAAMRSEAQGRLDRFLGPFRGPATRYLAGYAAWMVVREALPATAGAGCSATIWVI